MLFVSAVIICSVGYAQKTTIINESFTDTQARMIEATARSYVRPLVADVVVAKGETMKVFQKKYSRTEVEVAMGGNLDNLRSRVIYDATKDWDCEAVVAATFKIELMDDGKNYSVEMRGFPGNFDPESWHPMNENDFEWFDRVAKDRTIESDIVSSRSSMISREVVWKKRNWSTLGVEYLPIAMDFSSSSKIVYYNGLSLNYTNAFSLSQNNPLYIEWGLGVQYWCYLYYDEKYKVSEEILSVKVPLNLIYDIPYSKNVHFNPFIGVKFRYNLWGDAKNDDDIFSGDDCYERFQYGCQIGFKARFNEQFFIGFGYGSDINEIKENKKCSEFTIMAGFVF